jgi:menaquinone-dependent protoporphyrinogen oxidase
MEKNILVAYATRSGTTTGVAEVIASKLRARGAHVDVRRFEKAGKITDYDGVIAGSPIFQGQCADSMKWFLRLHAKELQRRPFAYFFTCLSLSANPNDDQQFPFSLFVDHSFGGTAVPQKNAGATVESYLTCVSTPQIPTPAHVAFFKGALDYSRLSFVHGLALRAISLIARDIKEGDFRNWKAINQWAEESLVPSFIAAPS